jgi:hypothetical protein
MTSWTVEREGRRRGEIGKEGGGPELSVKTDEGEKKEAKQRAMTDGIM